MAAASSSSLPDWARALEHDRLFLCSSEAARIVARHAPVEVEEIQLHINAKLGRLGRSRSPRVTVFGAGDKVRIEGCSQERFNGIQAKILQVPPCQAPGDVQSGKVRVLQDKLEKAQAEVEKLKSELELLQQAAKQEQGDESGRYIMETNEGPKSFIGAKLWPPSLEPSFADSPVRIVGMFFQIGHWESVWKASCKYAKNARYFISKGLADMLTRNTSPSSCKFLKSERESSRVCVFENVESYTLTPSAQYWNAWLLQGERGNEVVCMFDAFAKLWIPKRDSIASKSLCCELVYVAFCPYEHGLFIKCGQKTIGLDKNQIVNYIVGKKSKIDFGVKDSGLFLVEVPTHFSIYADPETKAEQTLISLVLNSFGDAGPCSHIAEVGKSGISGEFMLLRPTGGQSLQQVLIKCFSEVARSRIQACGGASLCCGARRVSPQWRPC